MAHATGSWHRGWLDLDWLVNHWLAGWGISRALSLSVITAGLVSILSIQIPHLPLFWFGWLVGTAPLWLPVALVLGAWHVWIWYAQSLYLSKREAVLLEMKIPREIMKSPRAMELAFMNFNLSSGETTVFHRFFKGQVRPPFSFEIASFGGELHFYVWTWKSNKEIVETALYGAYPEIELIEVEDYASAFRYDPEKHKAWGVEWPLMTGMGIDATDFRINAYQPRSYVDFELDKDPKEELKVDPFASVLEFMSSIKPNEQLWMQIIVRKSGKLSVFTGKPDEDTLWKKMVEKEVNKLRTQAAIIPADTLEEALGEAGEEAGKHVSPRPSWRQQEMIRAMERHLGKLPFQVGMRGIYWAEGSLRGPIYTGFRWMWRPFGNPNYGTHLRPCRWHCDFDYPWQDFHGLRWIRQTYRVLDAFRRRSFFYTPWRGYTNVLTNETLASLWRPPSRTIVAPGLSRISATKTEPPANLPK